MQHRVLHIDTQYIKHEMHELQSEEIPLLLEAL